MARTKNFDRKLVAGSTPSEAELIARIGNEAATPGAKLQREFEFAILLHRITGKRLPPVAHAMRQIAGSDSATLRQIADLKDAARRAEKSGPANRAFAAAAAFVAYCQSEHTLPEDLMIEIAKVPTLRDAARRGPFTPTVTQIWDHLHAVLEDGAPDRKSVERWAVDLGVKPIPRARKAR